MSGLDDFSAALASLPVDSLPSGVYRLLATIEAAWAQAEDGFTSEAEARRWSPVCDEALRFVSEASR